MPAGQPAQDVRIDICYEPNAGGTLTNFAGASWMKPTVGPQRGSYPAAETVVPGAGTWKVSLCVRNDGQIALSNNNYTNGWVQVTN